MPLSEHEQRLLEQMERALYAEDPKFATSMRNPRAGSGDRRRVALGVLGFLAGMGLLLTGVATQLVAVGVAGFLAMLGSIWLVLRAWHSAASAAPAAGAAAGHAKPGPRGPQRPRAKQRRSGSLTERMEQRWRRRRETGNF